MAKSKSVVQAAGALSPDQVKRFANKAYVKGLGKADDATGPKVKPTPYGISPALGLQPPTTALQPDPKLNEPGPTAMMRPEPVK